MRESQDESQVETLQATIPAGFAQELQTFIVNQSNPSLQNLEVDDLDDHNDDFMETYVAMNPDLKVVEAGARNIAQGRNSPILRAQDDSGVVV